MGTYAGDTIAVQPDETGAATQERDFVSAAAGAHTFTATYQGDNYYAPASASVTVNVQTGSAPSNMVLTCSPTGSTVQAASCTAQLAPGSAGYVAFSTTSFHAFAPINANGQASISTEFVGTPQGTYNVGASYGGDGTHTSSVSTATVVVNSGTPASEALASNVTVSCTPSAVVAPQTTTCTAQVPAGATGTVTFSHGSGTQLSVPVDGIGYATATNLYMGAAAGTSTLTAHYSGDIAYAASNASTSVTVVQAGTNSGNLPTNPPTLSTACNSPINLNGSSNCIAYVTPGATGYITFYSSATGRTIAVPIDASGEAFAPHLVSNVAAGTYTVTASYGGDQTYAGYQTSAAVTVQNTGTTTTNMGLSCSPTTLASSGTLTCTAQLQPGATGNVTFSQGMTTLGTVTINAQGQATLSSTVSLSSGNHAIVAVYGGDSNFTGAFASASVSGGTPSITSISLSEGPVGMGLVITGTNLGGSQGDNVSVLLGSVSVGYTPMTVLSGTSSSTSITVDVPNGATSGYIFVNVNGATSNSVPFTVTLPFGCN